MLLLAAGVFRAPYTDPCLAFERDAVLFESCHLEDDEEANEVWDFSACHHILVVNFWTIQLLSVSVSALE